jgi:hypothetical protein
VGPALVAAQRGRRGTASKFLGAILAAAIILAIALGCAPTLSQESGIVLEVESPALGRVDSFRLLTTEGEVLTFDTTSLAFRPEFPASHLAEHQVIGDLIVVTYRQDGERLVVTQLDDGGGPGH